MGCGWAAWRPPAPGRVCSCVPEPAWVRHVRQGTWVGTGDRLLAEAGHTSPALDEALAEVVSEIVLTQLPLQKVSLGLC